MKSECPFLCMRWVFSSPVEACPYIDSDGFCSDLEDNPGNANSWCMNKILTLDKIVEILNEVIKT